MQKAVGTPGAIRSGPKETKMKEDRIRFYLRKRYGMVGDDWEAIEVQENDRCGHSFFPYKWFPPQVPLEEKLLADLREQTRIQL